MTMHKLIVMILLGATLIWALFYVSTFPDPSIDRGTGRPAELLESGNHPVAPQGTRDLQTAPPSNMPPVRRLT